MTQERDCNTCANHVQGGGLSRQPSVCWDCSSGKGSASLPYWTPIKEPMCKSYDAAFRDDLDKDVQRRIQGAVSQGIANDIDKAILSPQKETSDGSSANYYKLPEGAKELQDLISYRNMNAQVGEMFRACYRLGQVSHSPRKRDLKKIIAYAQFELERIEKYGE